MKKISELLTDELLKRNIIEYDKREIYETGFELIISDTINVTMIFVFCIFTKSVLYGIIYILMMYAVRRFSGGFHAKTYTVCRIVTVGIYALIFLLNKYVINNNFICAAIINSTVMITMVLFAPIRHPNKILNEKEVKGNKFFSVLSTFLTSIISLFLVGFDRDEGMIISLTLLAIEVLMYIGLLVNRKGGIINDEKIIG